MYAPFRGLSRLVNPRSAGNHPQSSNTIWALKDVSFEIKRGEVVGIIGRNGAGKSTLLKILSRITEPTEGTAEIHGRVGSLLEVGTGFHPELTGRENIYLNAAILGMKKAEIERKFDEIVAFAEVEKFIDTPVKHYSSGMHVRLAFAVAAYLEPEILLVDEVLAVGDAGFQKKCLGKMGDVARQGRTVLFVSHNMAAINRLCSRAIWLQDGQLRRAGATTEIVGCYLAEGADIAAQVSFERRSNAIVQYKSVCVTDSKGNVSQYIPDDQEFAIELEIEAYEATSDVYFGMILQNSEGVNVLFADSRDVEQSLPSTLHSGRYASCLRFPPIFVPGRYTVVLGIATSHPVAQLDSVDAACSFEIVKNLNMRRTAPRSGIVNLKLPWNLERRSK
jgi:lipopolysaccharide transport system ATP-binding protein